MSRDLEVGEDLSKMNRQNYVDRLDLNHDRIIYQEVESKTTVELEILVFHRHLNLTFDLESICFKLV